MVEFLGDGGIAHYALNLLNALVKKGGHAQLFTAKSYEFYKSNLVTFKVLNNMFRAVYFLKILYPWIDQETFLPSIVRRIIKLFEYPTNIIELLWYLLTAKIKLVHFQSVNLIELLAVIAVRMINRRVVFTVHNVMPGHQKLYFYHKMLFKLMYSLCNEIIIHSEKGKEEIIELYNVNHTKIHVIPHGDYKFFIPKQDISKAEAKQRLGIGEKTNTILFFGALRENKGLKNILLALPYIKQQISPIKLMIVGEPVGSYEIYKKIIDEQNLQDEIYEKLDYVPNEEVAVYFFSSDLVVLPYNEITQSGILQISYAFGKPVVATDLGGFREAIEDGKNGYLVPLNNIMDLSNRCIEILIDKNKQKKMGEHSRFLSDNKYSWDSIAERTIEVYKNCLKAK